MPPTAGLELQASGPEACEWCEGVGEPELEYHCVGCDRGVCAGCVVLVVLVGSPREPWCPACQAAQEER